MRLSAFVALTVALSGCAAALPTPSAPGPDLRPTRYAMRVIGYVGAASDRTTLELALAERDSGRAPTAADFSALTWVTDAGRIPAQVESITSTDAGPTYRLVTMTSYAESLAPGKYTASAIEYQGDSNVLRRLEFGSVVLDVRQIPPAAVEFPNHSIGQTRLQFIELSARNMSLEPVTVRGLEFELPGVAVETTDAVEIAPGQTVELRFDFAVDDPAAVRFSELAPFMTVDSGGVLSLVSVPMQVYFGPFAGDGDLTFYLDALPSAASHPL